jgi:uncharacterized membrane protein YgcG
VREKGEARALLFQAAERSTSSSSQLAPAIDAMLWSSRAASSAMPLRPAMLAIATPQRSGAFAPLASRVVELVRAQLMRAIAVGDPAALRVAVDAASGESRATRRALASEITAANQRLAEVLRDAERALALSLVKCKSSSRGGSSFASPRGGHSPSGFSTRSGTGSTRGGRG